MPLHAPVLAARPFHTLSIQGQTFTAKTHTAINGLPGKVFIASTDRGWDGPVQRLYPGDFQDRFLISDYNCPIDFSADELFQGATNDDEKKVAKAAAERQMANVTRVFWQPFESDCLEAYKRADVASVVWDFADELYDWQRLAHFGKLERNPQLGYGLVNAEYQKLIRMAHQTHKNLVLVHRVKQKYKTETDPVSGKDKSVRDEGVMKRAGSDAADYLVHSFVETFRLDSVRAVKGQRAGDGKVYLGGEVISPVRFFVKIIKARLNPQVNGEVLESPNWMELMSYLAPDVPMERWLEEAA